MGEKQEKQGAAYGISSELNRHAYSLHCNLYLSTKKVWILVSGRLWTPPQDQRLQRLISINRWPDNGTQTTRAVSVSVARCLYPCSKSYQLKRE